MANKPGSVFISYRRGSGADVARLIGEFLEARGLDVFLDVDGLTAGHFDAQLLREIQARPNFVLICTKGSLDRCASPDDWVRREISCAIEAGCNIVPVTVSGFEWPAAGALPRDMARLQSHHAFEYSHTHWKLIRDRLLEHLKPSHGIPGLPSLAAEGSSGTERSAAATSLSGRSAPSFGGRAPTVRAVRTATIKTAKGDMEVEFFDADAPNTVANFTKLAKQGFYDGLKFHRVIEDFVIQGGCPNGTGTGGPGWKIKCETTGGNQRHDRGVLSMAHAGKDTGGSQFFICHSRNNTAHLDRMHTCFGKVVKGLEVIDAIKAGDKIVSVTVHD